jgi:tripartite-type tricarboxylate transporter receptor subunit TctC
MDRKLTTPAGALRGLFAGLALLGFAAQAPASAQDRYPSRPAKIVVPFGAGGVADITARLVAEKLGTVLNQRFVIENQPAAGGVTAAKSVLASEPDGYTIALLSNGTAISVSLIKDIGFDPLKDFQPVSSLAYFDFVLFTNAASPYKTLADLVAAGKTKPGGVNVGTVSVGSSQNLSAELLKATAGLNATIVPFRRTPDILVALLRNDVDVMIDTYAAAKSAVDDKQVWAIATSGTTRSPLLPDVPTVRESGAPEFEVTSWNGLFVPATTPQTVVDTLNKALREVLGSPDIKNRFLELGVEARATSPEELSARLKRDIEKWAAVIKSARIEPQ